MLKRISSTSDELTSFPSQHTSAKQLCFYDQHQELFQTQIELSVSPAATPPIEHTLSNLPSEIYSYEYYPQIPSMRIKTYMELYTKRYVIHYMIC